MISSGTIEAFADELEKIAGTQRFIRPVRKKVLGVAIKKRMREREARKAERAGRYLSEEARELIR